MALTKNGKPKPMTYKDFIVSRHTMQRAAERFNITSEKEVKKLALSAKAKGVSLKLLNNKNYKHFGLDKDTYLFLVSRYHIHNNTDKMFYYKDKVFVFTGFKSRVLKTIVDINSEEVRRWSRGGHHIVGRGLRSDWSKYKGCKLVDDVKESKTE